jgi:hypothetical protein
MQSINSTKENQMINFTASTTMVDNAYDDRYNQVERIAVKLSSDEMIRARELANEWDRQPSLLRAWTQPIAVKYDLDGPWIMWIKGDLIEFDIDPADVLYLDALTDFKIYVL